MRWPRQYKTDCGPGDAVMFVSKTGNQILWVYKTAANDNVVLSVRIRLRRGTWNPEMIQNYANEVGLEIEGIKRFEQYHAARVRNRAAA